MKKVRDVMTKGVVTIHLDTSVKEIAAVLIKNDISGVVAVDSTGETWGVVTDMDLVKCYAEGKTDVVAESIMSPQTLAVDPDMSLKDAAAFMHSHQIHRAFVMSARSAYVTKNIPIGVISATDVARELARHI
ncbi:MAG: CBS domain-containing protein [Methanocellales archaeon]|nr:CBS domain-containing protein [Methanocellales archaeon]MDD3291606.1 CBS domain-containing protein [Methanocellales archaeon]MDD5235175.1 CBS domain-containing protein [Methanocellales archaeon]MDD5485389.1 CBS domain-containing protein [Methanocellales archaeon]